MVVVPVTEHNKIEPAGFEAEPVQIRKKNAAQPRVEEESAVSRLDPEGKTMFRFPAGKSEIVCRNTETGFWNSPC